MKIKTLVSTLFVSSLLSYSTIEAQKKYTPDWKSIDTRPVPEWFEDAKFGIFIHWGTYAVPSFAPIGKDLHTYAKYSEWYWQRLVADTTNVGRAFRKYHYETYGKDFKYQSFADKFKAELFQPAEWANLFENAGAKYVVMTSKHHEGFAMWPSKYSWNWNSVDIGPHRDLVGDLTREVRKKGIKMGYYYSLLEWYHPLYKKESIQKYVDEHMIPQMKELVTTYKPDVFWTDGEWEYNSDTLKSPQFLAWLLNETSVKDVVYNDRWGRETRSLHGGFLTTEYGLIHLAGSDGMKFNKPWEENRSVGGSFGYNRRENLSDYSTVAELIYVMVEKFARGGNFLLNIGPAADGTIPVVMQERLLGIGKWLKTNGEAIYGSRNWEKSPEITPTTVQFYTKKNKNLYVILTKFPAQEVVVPNVSASTKVSMLGVKTNVKSVYKNGNLYVTMPVLTPLNNPSEHTWVLKLENAL